MDITENINNGFEAGLQVTISRTWDEGQPQYWLYIGPSYFSDLGPEQGHCLTEQMEKTSPSTWKATKKVVSPPEIRILSGHRRGELVTLHGNDGAEGYSVHIGIAQHFEISDTLGDTLRRAGLKIEGMDMWLLTEGSIS